MRTSFHYMFVMAGLLIGLSASAQEIKEEIDLLKAPASPASNLVGIAVDEVEHPTDVTSLMVSIRQATGDFGALPANYAVDFAPVWLFPGNGKLTSMSALLEPHEKNRWGKDVLQGLVVSTAFANLNGDLEGNTKAGFGMKLPLLKAPATAGTLVALRSLKGILAKDVGATVAEIAATEANDVDFQTYNAKANDATLSAAEQKKFRALREAQKRFILERLATSKHAAIEAEVEAAAKALKVERKGPFIDMAGGVAVDFLERDFNQGELSKGGLWFTGGSTAPRFDAVILTRWLVEKQLPGPSDSLATGEDVNDLDIGGSLLVRSKNERFTLSVEGIIRFQQLDEENTDTWRLVCNSSYNLGNNNLLTFSFGRNYDSVTTQSGNLVAALNLLLGLGKGPK
ncbi:MAG: hypothetical protein ABI432_02130 [Flavobacteriales bacterium]